MKPNGWKPLVIIQCYEDRQQTLALRKVTPPPAKERQQKSADAANGPPPPPPMPEGDGPQKSEAKNCYAKFKGYNGVNIATNSANGKIISNVKLSTNGAVNSNANNGIPNGKPYGAIANGIKRGNIAVSEKTVNGTTNGAGNGTPANGTTNVTLANGTTNGTLVNGTTNGALAKAFAASNGPANGILANGKSNATIKRTPTPDYETSNTDTLARLKLKSQAETVEVDSIESYKMKNPPSPQPKPPSTYFKRQPNGTATMKKTARPVSITIGEYPSKVFRKEPSKLEFLNGEGKSEVDHADEAPIGSRLQSELAMTLSRSNLRKKTELMAKLDSNGNIAVDKESDVEPDKNFHKRYGNNLMPTPPHVTIPKVPLVKTNSHPISQHIAMLAGKVTGRQENVEQLMTVNGDH